MALVAKRKAAVHAGSAAADSPSSSADAVTPVGNLPGAVTVPPSFDAAMTAATAAGADSAEVGKGNGASAPIAGDDVAELRSSLHELQELVTTLMARTLPVDESSGPVGGRDTDAASRIIVAANHAAEATIESARVEADELITTAKAKSFEIIGVAKDLADQELAAERDRVATASEAWSSRRDAIADRLVDLEASMASCRTDLETVGEAIRSAIDQLRADAAGDAARAEGSASDAGAATDATEATDVADAVGGGESVDADGAATDPNDSGAPPVVGADDESRPLPSNGRSNLFGGDAATRRAAGGAGSLPFPGGTTGIADGGSTNGGTTNGGTTNGAAEPNRLRAGFFGR